MSNNCTLPLMSWSVNGLLWPIKWKRVKQGVKNNTLDVWFGDV